VYLPTTIVTVAPLAATVLGRGVWLMTIPFWLATVTVCGLTDTWKLATSSVADATASVTPVTDGTIAVVGALATVSVTSEPGLARELPAGDCARTVPAAAESDGLVTTLTANWPSTAWADDSRSPVT